MDIKYKKLIKKILNNPSLLDKLNIEDLDIILKALEG